MPVKMADGWNDNLIMFSGKFVPGDSVPIGKKHRVRTEMVKEVDLTEGAIPQKGYTVLLLLGQNIQPSILPNSLYNLAI